MGKKSKGNKLAKMSEEERARYLQLRADIEEETRRRKILLIALFMKNKLKREDVFCRLNMAKINQEWRYILRQVKCQELRNELINLRKSCEQLLQHKDQVIKRLWHDLNVAHDMHDTLFQSHLETIQNFKDIQEQRMEFLRQNYEQQKHDLLNENQEEYNEWKRISERSEVQLENIYYQLEEKTNNEQMAAEEKYLEKLDDLHATTQIKIEEITEKGEKKLQEVWSKYQQILDKYNNHTEHYYAEYLDLQEQDADYTKQTYDYYHEVQILSHHIINLKLLLKGEVKKGENIVKYLKTLREHLNGKLKNLKSNVDRELRNQNELFKIMSVVSYQAIKTLKKQHEKGKTLLQLASVCRKIENEREQLLSSTLPPPRFTKKVFLPNNDNDDKYLQGRQENIGNCNMNNWLLMENFWKRINNVKIDLLSLQQQKKALQAENQRYKCELQNRLIHLNMNQGKNIHATKWLHLSKRPNSMPVERIKHNAVDIEKQSTKCRSAKPTLEKVARQRFPYTCITEANITNAVRLEQFKSKCDKRILLAKIN